MDSSNETQLLGHIHAALREVAPDVQAATLTPSTTIADLGLDSVTTMELVAALEQRLGVHIPDDQLARVDSVGQLIALIRRHRS